MQSESLQNFQFMLPDDSQESQEDLNFPEIETQLDKIMLAAMINCEKYQINSVVYHSYNSKIYSCTCMKSSNKVVLKTGYRCREEGELLIKLSHPKIISVLQVVSQGFFMPKYKHSLGKHINHSKQPFPIQLILFILKDLCSALLYLHEKGIVHGDVKPDNILFNEDQRTFVLCDLGNYLITGFEDKKRYPTQTLSYRSPQTFEKIFSEVMDSWGVGCILYECLTGESFLPLTLENEQQLRSIFQVYLNKERIKSELRKNTASRHIELFEGPLLKLLQPNPKSRMTIRSALQTFTKLNEKFTY